MAAAFAAGYAAARVHVAPGMYCVWMLWYRDAGSRLIAHCGVDEKLLESSSNAVVWLFVFVVRVWLAQVWPMPW